MLLALQRGDGSDTTGRLRAERTALVSAHCISAVCSVETDPWAGAARDGPSGCCRADGVACQYALEWELSYVGVSR
jgi:hypothetical protein